MKDGFFTALGTPLDENGKLVAESLKKEIAMQIEAGASGLLLMGSMGMEASVPDGAYTDAVQVAAEANAGRLPLFVGAMDNSVQRVLERLWRIEDYDFDYAVVTTPFYFASEPETLNRFFEAIADRSPRPVFLYDLPTVTKCKITYPMVQRLAQHPNIQGIKSNDPVLARLIKRNLPDFTVLYSNLDNFDAAVSFGIRKVLDGMLSATPKNARAFVDAALSGDIEGSGRYLDNIILLRDTYVRYGIMPSFTHSMNLLGMAGNFAPDYFGTVSDEGKAAVEAVMKQIGEL